MDKDPITEWLKNTPTYIRVDKKELINSLRALSDCYIELYILDNKKTIILKDRSHYIQLRTKN